ncbi:putative MFS family arabinose efflux permease [Chitinophaga skermanii]|uniref:Putative MFS family arabinose efflux permease n=2 Tax=Chitinophaga skermanii TaxID=331697 RepID=A0A327QCC2_9BACT|nr:putative MFS family arabinose efflux permease [Chitinophaga skermanii]
MMIPELPAYLTQLGGADYKGYIIGLFTLMAGLSRPFSGKLSDTIGRVPVMIFGSLVCVVCSLLYPLVSSVFAFLLLRFFHGFSTGFKPTGTSAYVADIVPFNRRAEAMGMVGLASTIGLSLGPSIGGWMSNMWGIHTMFQASAMFALLSVVILVGSMKETLQNRQRFSFKLLKIQRNEIFEPLVIGPMVVTFLTYVSYGTLLTIIPDFSAHLGVQNKGLFFTFFTASSIGIRLLAGKSSDKWGRVPILKISSAMLAVSMVMLAMSGSPNMMLAGALVYGAALGLNSPAISAWTIDLGDPMHKGRALASMYIALEAGIGIGAYLSAFIFHNDPKYFAITFYLNAAITVFATVYLMFIYPGKQRLRNTH